jgi:hypothetical protein
VTRCWNGEYKRTYLEISTKPGPHVPDNLFFLQPKTAIVPHLPNFGIHFSDSVNHSSWLTSLISARTLYK